MTDDDRRGLPVGLTLALAPGTAGFDEASDWPALLETTLEHLPHVDAASVLERSADGTVRFGATVGFDHSALSELEFPPSALDPSHLDGVLIGQRLDATVLPDEDREVLRQAGIGGAFASSISVAIRPGGRLIGYLQFYARDAGAFQASDAPRFTAISELVAARVDRGTLVKALKRARRDLDRISTHDPVTGLANRALLLDRIEQAVARDQRADRTTALLRVVVQDMPRMYDAYGHELADEMLKVLASSLVRATRRGDTVAHLGGGEFSVLASGIDEIQQIESLVESIEHLSDRPVELGPVTLHPHLAIGVALSPTDGRSPDALIQCAELASARAVALPRQQVAWFMHDVDREQRERSRRAEELRAALISGQGIWVAFQPVHRMSDGACLGIEALARWDRATRSDDMIPPSVFGALTEELGMTHVLSRRVYDRAFSVFSSLAPMRGEQHWRLGLNLSVSQLKDDDLVHLLRDLSETHDVPLEDLDLEVPAEMIFAASAAALQRLRTLREVGCRIVVDDFAALRDEIERLEGLPIDVLKIDPRWTREVSDGLTRRRVEGIVSAARRLGLAVVAEGVETEAAARDLADLGVDALQGVAVTPPMHAAALLAYLSTRSLGD